MFGWFRKRRRRKLLAEPFPEEWVGYLKRNVRFFRTLTDDEQLKLCDDLRIVVAERDWEGCGGLEVTDEMKVTVAAQACLLTLHIEHDYYRRVPSILLYPATYRAPTRAQHGEITPVGGHGVLGQAVYRGPVVLSWQSALMGARDEDDGRNVVFHEFAHKLDMADDLVDGTPRLHSREDYADWTRVMTHEYETLCEKSDKGRATLLDKYGATNEGEFFACAVECFFEKPKQMLKKHAELYGVLKAFFRQDPASRVGT